MSICQSSSLHVAVAESVALLFWEIQQQDLYAKLSHRSSGHVKHGIARRKNQNQNQKSLVHLGLECPSKDNEHQSFLFINSPCMYCSHTDSTSMEYGNVVCWSKAWLWTALRLLDRRAGQHKSWDASACNAAYTLLSWKSPYTTAKWTIAYIVHHRPELMHDKSACTCRHQFSISSYASLVEHLKV